MCNAIKKIHFFYHFSKKTVFIQFSSTGQTITLKTRKYSIYKEFLQLYEPPTVFNKHGQILKFYIYMYEIHT